MTIEAVTHHANGEVKAVTTAALVSGQVVQLPSGRPAVYVGLKAAAAGDYVTLATTGVRKVLKTASVALLAGQEAWWKVSTNRAIYHLAGDYYLGVVAADAPASASTVLVDLDAAPSYVLDTAQRTGEWVTESTLGLGVVESYGGLVTLAFDAVSEAAQAALYSNKTVDVDDGPVFEAEIAIYAIGAAANDFNIGLASGSHATDFDAVTACAAFHFDANDLTAKTQTDDNVTPVSADDSGVDLVDDTFAFLQIDARDKADIKFYINGVQLNTDATFHLNGYTSTLLPILHVEKTSDAAVADLRCRRMTLRTSAAA